MAHLADQHVVQLTTSVGDVWRDRRRVAMGLLRMPFLLSPEDWVLETDTRQPLAPGHAPSEFGLARSIHPPAPDRPAVLSRRVAAAGDMVWFLHMEVSATNDWVCAVQCNGREVFRGLINNRGSWRTINLLLPSDPGRPEYELKIFNHAGGVHAWHDELGYFSNLRVYSPD